MMMMMYSFLDFHFVCFVKKKEKKIFVRKHFVNGILMIASINYRHINFSNADGAKEKEKQRSKKMFGCLLSTTEPQTLAKYTHLLTCLANKSNKMQNGRVSFA